MSDAKWYVVHTYSGYENKVKVDIEKTIENRHLEWCSESKSEKDVSWVCPDPYDHE